jgi:hypothetical protein
LVGIGLRGGQVGIENVPFVSLSSAARDAGAPNRKAMAKSATRGRYAEERKDRIRMKMAPQEEGRKRCRRNSGRGKRRAAARRW